ncbi:C4-dicarboxylate ABC transporter [Clostridiales bacterium PH28_bin88]|nr:C4-dicarboxylate ABC transporter [Clostridiales bacterium PH28_bin88]
MKKFYEYICKAEVYVAKGSLTILTVLVFLSAVARSLHYPIVWAMDAATFLFAWCVFLSADMAMRNDKLVTIDVLTSRLSKKARFYLKLFNHLIIILFLAFLIRFGLSLAYTSRFVAFQGIPGFSYTWVALSVPVGCTLMLITTILKIREHLRRGYELERNIDVGKEFL